MTGLSACKQDSHGELFDRTYFTSSFDIYCNSVLALERSLCEDIPALRFPFLRSCTVCGSWSSQTQSEDSLLLKRFLEKMERKCKVGE